MIMELNAGDRVKITGTIVSTDEALFGSITFRPDGGRPSVIYRPFDLGAVEKLNPVDWPPQVGDIWEADGLEYCAWSCTLNKYGTMEPYQSIALTPFDGTDLPSYVDYRGMEDFRHLNPKLIRRREATEEKRQK
jgi:hypothetical protein